MAAITGANAKAALKLTGTFGTAATCGAGDMLAGNTITHSENTEELTVAPMGSGLSMKKTSDRGGVSPTLNISGPLGFHEPKLVGLTQMFNGASVTSLANGNGAYIHSILFNTTANTKFNTVAWQATDAASFEYPSAATTQAVLAGQARPDYVTLALDLLADQQKISAQTNTFAQLATVTEADTDSRKVPFQFSDSFWINSQSGGILSASDILNITDFSITYARPQEHAREAKGSTGNGQPISVGDFPFTANIQVTCRTLEAFTYFTAHQAETEYKAQLNLTSAVAAGGTWYYWVKCYFPRLKLVTPPQSDLSAAGNNPLTLNFEALVASSVPTGMAAVYPHLTIINKRSTSLLT